MKQTKNYLKVKKKKINFTGSQLLLFLSFYYAIHREKRAL